jgi:ELWxxDGT repeat protein
VLVADTDPGPGGPDVVRHGVCTYDPPSDLVEKDGIVYFFATHPQVGRELWRSDGTAGGTWLVKDALPGPDAPPHARGPEFPDPDELVQLGDALFFRRGGDLWTSDGTPEGTRRVADVYPLVLTSSRFLLFFASTTGLWASDGTEAGTRLASPLDLSTSPRFDNDVAEMAALGDGLVFEADDGVTGIELWYSDGTPQGTVLVRDIQVGDRREPDTASLLSVGPFVYFAAEDDAGPQLWRTDGRTAERLSDLRPGLPPIGSYPKRWFGRVGDLLLFPADDGRHGVELWGYRLP